MNILEKIKLSRTYFDGGMGTLLQEKGLQPSELPELWNITHSDIITDIHKAYYASGCNIVTTNTFGANRLKFDNLEEIISAAINNAKKARDQFSGDRYIAYDIGSLGKMLKPLGDLEFEDAVSIFADGIKIADKCGADLILIETMNDSYETKAAVLAAKENSTLPIFVTCVYDERAKLMTGADPAAMVAMLEGLRVDALGMNCSLGPEQMLGIVPKLVSEASIPVIVNPNAGLPKSVNGKTVYDIDAEIFSDYMIKIAECGATILGGCCGTTPEFIRKTIEKTKTLPYSLPTKKNKTAVSSYTHAVKIGEVPVLIGERINPTGKSKFKQALRDNNVDYILNEGITQQDAGADILDVNVGLPEIDETAMMTTVVQELQAVSDLPLQIDTVDPVAMEKAMRIYNGKPLVNSVNGKKESMNAVFPLVKKYGGTVIALTIGEKGIPETAQGRYEIAKLIVEEAQRYGIDRKDIVVDPLAMTISSDTESANVTLESIRLIEENLGVHDGPGFNPDGDRAVRIAGMVRQEGAAVRGIGRGDRNVLLAFAGSLIVVNEGINVGLMGVSRTASALIPVVVGFLTMGRQFTMQVSEEEFYRITAEEAAADFDPIELVYEKEVPVFEKYDEYVPPELIRKGFAHGVLDIKGMKNRVLGWNDR